MRKPRILGPSVLLWLFAFGAAGDEAEIHRELLPHPTEASRQIEYFWTTPDGDGPWPAVLFVHGHQIGKRPGARIYLERPILAEAAAKGFVAAAVSQPGYGESDGPPDFCGPVSQQAVRAVLDALRESPRVDGDRVALYGFSRGAIVSSMVGTQYPRLAALVVGGGSYDLGAAYERLPESGLKSNIEREAGTTPEAFRARSALLADSPIKAPTLILHGEGDEISPVEDARRLETWLREAGTPVELVVFEGRDHHVPWDEKSPILYRFLERHLAASSPAVD